MLKIRRIVAENYVTILFGVHRGEGKVVGYALTIGGGHATIFL